VSTLLTETQPELAGPVGASRTAVAARPFSPVVVAPTFANANTLPAVLAQLVELGLPVIVVNDGSTDGTADVLATWAAVDPAGRTVLSHGVNRGKAAALRTAFAHAAGSGLTHAVTIDTDGQLSPADVAPLLERARARPTALVLGTRAARVAGYPARSRFGRWVSNQLVWLECGQAVADSQCGLRVYPLAFANAAHCLAERYGFETEVITRAAWAGVPVAQVPVSCRYFPPGERVSHFRPVVDSVRAIAMHVRLIAAACNPLALGRPVARRSPTGHAPPRGRSIPRRFLRWVNPITAWRQARRDDAGRTRFAAGFAAGVSIGALPLYGGQTILSLFVARKFRLHPASVITGSNLSGPPIGVALIAAEVAVGHLLLHGSWPVASSYVGGHLGAVLRPLLCEWVVGSLIVGLALAGPAFLAVDLLLRALPEPSTDADA
jgi:uncharacterized protein (DUF2062 family)